MRKPDKRPFPLPSLNSRASWRIVACDEMSASIKSVTARNHAGFPAHYIRAAHHTTRTTESEFISKQVINRRACCQEAFPSNSKTFIELHRTGGFCGRAENRKRNETGVVFCQGRIDGLKGALRRICCPVATESNSVSKTPERKSAEADSFVV